MIDVVQPEVDTEGNGFQTLIEDLYENGKKRINTLESYEQTDLCSDQQLVDRYGLCKYHDYLIENLGII